MDSPLFSLHFMVNKIRGRDEYEIYRNYVNDLPSSVITAVLSNIFESDRLKKKSDIKSQEYRKLGNDAYKNNDYTQTMEMYTKSLCYATYNSEAYATTLANRSAVFFKMCDYESCIKDIDLCFQAKYPEVLKPKVCIRKAECFKKLGEAAKMRNTLLDVLDLIDTMTSDLALIAENYRKAVKELITEQVDVKSHVQNNYEILPTLDVNPSFLNASAAVELHYNKSRGTRVVAKQDIVRGDVLFVEKAFVFNNIGNDEEVIPVFCQYCLMKTANYIPCKGCVEHVYCTENCRDSAWDDFHQWECVGFQTDLFMIMIDSHLALRAIFKGLHTGLSTSRVHFEDGTIENYGNANDNYPYVYSLPINIKKTDKGLLMAIVADAAVLVNYLKVKTNFFSHLKKLPEYAKKSDKVLMNEIGGLIIRHCTQLCTNRVGIAIVKDGPPIRKVTISSAFCPSMTMMNHSCIPNTTHYFVGDTVVVKAIENIKPNQEVSYSYLNISYYTERNTNERQRLLEEKCSLKCKCRACADPRMSLEAHNAYLCVGCQGPAIGNEVFELPMVTICRCLDCNYKFVLPQELACKEKFLSAILLRFGITGNIEDGIRGLEIGKTIYRPFHEKIRLFYKELSNCYLQLGDIQRYMETCKLFINCIDNIFYNNLPSGVIRYDTCATCIGILKDSVVVISVEQMGKILDDLKNMVDEVKIIMDLHYPPFLAKLEELDKSISELQVLNTTE